MPDPTTTDLAQAMKGEDRFMPQVQRKLIEESSKGDPRRALMVAWNAQANQHAVVAHTGLVRRAGVVQLATTLSLGA